MIKKFHANIFSKSAVYLLVAFLLALTLNACGGAKPAEVVPAQQPSSVVREQLASPLPTSAPTAANTHSVYLPGMGIVDQSASLRVLAEPVSQTRDGVSVTVKEAVLSSDKTIVVIAFENIPAYKISHESPECRTDPEIRLPGAAPLQPTNGRREYWGTKMENLYEYAPIPSGTNNLTLFVQCVPGDRTPRTLPENWELPLRFIPAPSDMIKLPVIEYAPSSNSGMNNGMETNPITITKAIDTGDSYILIGKHAIPTMSTGYGVFGAFGMMDGNGTTIPWNIPSDIVLPQDSSPDSEDWIVKVNKGFVPPLTLKYFFNSSYPAPTDTPLEFEFDAGENPQIGNEWQLNQEFNAGGHFFTLKTVRAAKSSVVQGKNSLAMKPLADTIKKKGQNLFDGYDFSFSWFDTAILGVYVDISGYPFVGHSSGMRDVKGESSFSFLGFSELPKGKLKISLSVELTEPQEWTLQWQPESAFSDSTPSAETPRACLTADSWQAAISNPVSIPSDLSGRLVAFGRTVEDGKDPNPDNTGMFTINLDGSDKKALGRGMGAVFSPDGARIVYFSPDKSGLYIVDVASSATSHIPNTIANDYFPRWSPDGKQIAFMRSADSDLYIINSDGTGLRRVFQGIDYEQLAGWTPDGKGLYYSVGTQTGSEFRKVDIESGKIVKLFDEGVVDISPDGSKVVFFSDFNKAYISNIDGSGRKLLADMENWSLAVPVIWSPDGKWLIANIRKPADPDIAGFPIPHALVNVEDCRIIPLPWYGDAYDWIP